MSVGSTTALFSLRTALNVELIRADSAAFTATYVKQEQFDIPVSTSPLVPAFSTLVTLPAFYMYNAHTAAVVISGTGIGGLSIPAGQSIFIPAIDLTTNVTFTATSGTGTVYVLLLK